MDDDKLLAAPPTQDSDQEGENPEEEEEVEEEPEDDGITAIVDRLAGLATVPSASSAVPPPAPSSHHAHTIPRLVPPAEAIKPTQHMDSIVASRLDYLPSWVANLQGTDADLRLDAATSFRKVLSIERSPPIAEVIRSGAVPLLAECLLSKESDKLVFEAAWALTNVASGTSVHTRFVVDHGVLPIAVDVLKTSQSADCKEQMVWLLGNIAGDSPELRDEVLEAGAMDALLPLFSRSGSKLTMLRNATWTLSNFCRGKPAPSFTAVRPALSVLPMLIQCEDEEVLIDACWAASYLSDGVNPKIQAVIESGIVPRLVELLNHPSASIQTPALRTVGNIVTGDDLQTQLVVDAGVLRAAGALLSSPKRSIVKETCWTLSNITAGSSNQIQQYLDADLLDPVVHLLRTGEFDVKKEAAWCIANISSGGTPTQVSQLLTSGGLDALANLLTASDEKIIMVSLEGIENIGRCLKELGQSDAFEAAMEHHLSMLEELQSHESTSVYEKTSAILTTYFEVEEADTGAIPAFAPFSSSGMHAPAQNSDSNSDSDGPEEDGPEETPADPFMFGFSGDAPVM